MNRTYHLASVLTVVTDTTYHPHPHPHPNEWLSGIVPVILQTLRDEPFEVVRAATGGEGAGNSAAARQQQTVSLASTLFGMIGEGGLGQDLALPKVSKILQMFINIRCGFAYLEGLCDGDDDTFAACCLGCSAYA